MNISKEQGLLIAYGGRPYIPPREVHKDFFAHIGFNAFKASGVRCELPFPIFRLSDSRKSEYFVSVRELAKAIADKEEEAKSEYRKFRS
ncbi:TPA: pyocin activator PrtN family protein [Neisseria gonorrhoeae]|uniref:pyocin activator PrtN family protein n=1 Tax=Neisseria gonorrhoeae TaxID=485 RepID=UPI0017801E89|nr:pyocin activator PrtN family protein [Neisseria gonorrhoeae]MCF2985024.1 pyocin activator PrtN family protein [Neisseria gonorrhoeae]MCF3066030.1 pyocin activator PrtN family protein [Neisseria gonorrhoeae]QOG48898.1 pyocin activator PrtN family protein [Neisseria gonorrhoeae]